MSVRLLIPTETLAAGDVVRGRRYRSVMSRD